MRSILAVCAALLCCVGCVSKTVDTRSTWIYSDEVAWHLMDIEGRALPSTHVVPAPRPERYRPSPPPIVPARYRVGGYATPAHAALRTGTSYSSAGTVLRSRMPAAPRPRVAYTTSRPATMRVSEHSVGPVPRQNLQLGSGSTYVAPRTSVGYPVRATYRSAPVVRLPATTRTHVGTQYVTSRSMATTGSYSTTTTNAYRGDTGLAARRTTYSESRNSK